MDPVVHAMKVRLGVGESRLSHVFLFIYANTQINSPSPELSSNGRPQGFYVSQRYLLQVDF